MKIFGILLTVFFMNTSFAQEALNCKATGKVDNIIELSFQSSDLEGQICGNFKIAAKDKLPEASVYTCFNGLLMSAENVLFTTDVSYGVNKLLIRKDVKTGEIKLMKTFECDYNHEEKCLPGAEEVLAEEVLQCTVK